MRSAFRLIAIFAAFFVTETILLAQPSLAGCTIYQDRGYGGQSLQFKRNQSREYVGRLWDNKASSVKVTQGCRLITFENSGYVGDKRTFRQNASFVGGYWNDEVSSAKCLCGIQSHANLCVVHDSPSATGRHGHIDRDGEVEDFGSKLRGKISSISVPAGCQLKAYDRKDLTGRERTYGAGKVQLTGSRWDNKIASAQCQCSPQEPAKPVVDTSSEPRSCVMYENTRRAGEQLSLKEQTGFRWVGGDWKDRVSSADVPENCELRVYSERDYGGDEKVLKTGAHNRLGFGWNDKTRSAKCLCTARSTRSTLPTLDPKPKPILKPKPVVAESCVVYAKAGYRGTKLEIGRNTELARFRSRLADNISSVRVPDGCRLEAFSRTRLRGNQTVLNRDTFRLDVDVDDTFASARCACASPRVEVKAPVVEQSCQLYGRSGMAGISLKLNGNQTMKDLGDDWDDRVSSAVVSQGCRLEIYKRRSFKGGRRLLGVGAHRSLPSDWDDETSSAKCMCEQVKLDRDAGDQSYRDDDGYDDNRDSAGLGSSDAKACLLFSGRQGAGRRYRIEAGNKLDDIASRVRSLEIPDGCVLSGYPRENQQGDQTMYFSGPRELTSDDRSVRSADCRCRRTQ